jgi:hypothetical protein
LSRKRIRQAGPAIAAFVLLLLSVNAYAQTITITVSSSASGVNLAGSGTNAVSFSAGVISRTGGSLPIGITRSTTVSDWTLGTPFDVLVTKDVLVTSASYTLQAILSTPDAERTWQVDSVPLNSSGNSTLSMSGTYAATTEHTLEIVIPDSCAAGAFSNTVSLIAVSN